MASACAGTPSIEASQKAALKRKAALIEKLSTVKVSDGVSRDEAVIIAENFAEKFIGCGGYEKITEEQDSWVAHYVVGYAGVPDSSTKISKKDGVITTKLAGDKMKLYPKQLWN